MAKRYDQLTKAFELLLNEKAKDLQQDAMTRLELIWQNTLDEWERNINQKNVQKAIANKSRLNLLNEVREQLE